jgi:two-component sensor histidine kinase
MKPVGMKVDISGRRGAADSHPLLVDELNHRLRNVLAYVHLIVERSRREADSVDALAAMIISRLDALAHAHARVSQSNSAGTWLTELVEDELAPYQSNTNVSVEGSDLPINEQAIQALSMVLHELTTNAVKHGALSTPEGRVTVRWHVAGEISSAPLILIWEESDGPTVAAPTRQGFGTRLIHDVVQQELGGEVELSLLPRGVRCEIEVPLARVAGTNKKDGDGRLIA